MKRKSGTREWAEVNKNFCLGCENDCRYCYARADAVRFKRIGVAGEWADQTINNGKFLEKPKKVAGRIMFPTTHDIVPKYLKETIEYLRRWLEVGNEILVVSKPNRNCIAEICCELREFRDQMTFRFTIGSKNDDVLRFWDRNAPLFEERMDALKFAYETGFQTSVSHEPYLDKGIVDLVRTVIPFVTDTAWVGKMNRVKLRVRDVPADNPFLVEVLESQTDEFIKTVVYPQLKDIPQVRWKESIQKVLGLQSYEGVG